MPQQSLTEFINDMEAAGLLVRVTDEVRVDDLPRIMEDHPTTAVLVENIKDCEFSFLANAYSNHDMYALAMGCDKRVVGLEMVDRASRRIAPVMVEDAPVHEVVLTGDDIDLTVLPMFLHHERDGQSYSDDNLVISKDPETGVPNWGFYRSMYRSKNERNFDMTCTSHRSRINAMKAASMGKNLEIAVVIGGPTLDKLSALKGFPPDVNDFEVLGSFYGEPAKMVKCKTVDLEVPANAEIVIEAELMALEGWTHDEAPFGEFTGMYGGGMKHNVRCIVKAITYRKGGIFQYATIGGGHPWYTDNMLQLPALEADLFGALKDSALDVIEVRAPASGLSNIAYAKIRKQGAGDGKQALSVMLGASKMALPKVAYVFDEDIDIWDDNEINWAMAFRYDPARGTVIIPDSNTMTVDPTIPKDAAPGTTAKIGFDMTIPFGPKYVQSDFTRSAPFILPEPEADAKPMTEAEITEAMRAMIKQAPRSWKEILTAFNGQNYRDIYRAFGNLRSELGRVVEPPYYPYAFKVDDSDFIGEASPGEPTATDIRHHKH